MNDLRRTERIFSAAADPNRLRILKMLEVKPMCVCEITACLGIAQSSVSRHLSLLRDAGLVADSKRGLWVDYSLAARAGGVVSAVLAVLRRWDSDDPQIRADREKASRLERQQICAGLKSSRGGRKRK
jgi:ArsR family transcriptional regulator